MANNFRYESARCQWLYQHGKRGEVDVLTDLQGEEFVYMTNGEYDEKVYLPRNCQQVFHRPRMEVGGRV